MSTPPDTPLSETLRLGASDIEHRLARSPELGNRTCAPDQIPVTRRVLVEIVELLRTAADEVEIAASARDHADVYFGSAHSPLCFSGMVVRRHLRTMREIAVKVQAAREALR